MTYSVILLYSINTYMYNVYYQYCTIITNQSIEPEKSYTKITQPLRINAFKQRFLK